MNNKKQISPERKTIYYFGMAMSVLGPLMFLTMFFAMITNFGDVRFHPQTFFLIAAAGLVVGAIGNGIMRIAVRGWSGSGIVLDPEQAQRDVEPWSRMTGGIINDALSEVDTLRDVKLSQPAPAPVVKVRCPHCKALNDEIAKFCNQCGGVMS